MQVDESYYRGEERDGFYVDGMMKRCWAAEIEVLEELDRICKKHGITWYAASGTLLGAIRHKGFIPWDDDIDIAMKREDYEKFRKVVRKEMPEKFRFYDLYTKDCSDGDAARFQNQAFIDVSRDHLRKFHGCPFVAGVDVFPLDYIPRDKELQKMRMGLFSLTELGIRMLRGGATGESIEDILRELRELSQMDLVNDNTILEQLYHLADSLCMLFTEEQSDEVAALLWLITNEEHSRYHKEWYEDVVYMPFENTVISVPSGYDKILQTLYGDYMKKIRDSSYHEYPCYGKQLDIMKRRFAELGDTRDVMEIIESLMQ